MIDVHQHPLPERYVEAIGAGPIGSQGSSGKVPAWSIEAALEGMDEAGIGCAILSISSPGFAGLDGPRRQMQATASAIAALPWSEDDKARLRRGNAAVMFPGRR